MKDRNYTLLVFSHALIGVGSFFLYTYFVRSVFEFRTHFTTLTQLERESLFRKEDALYYAFYKTITAEPDFARGYQRLQNMTSIEYPNSVNVVQRFHVLPELIIGYLFHSVRKISHELRIPIVTCWTLDENSLSPSQLRCDGFGEPHRFYLEFVWILGGFTIFLIYMYATFLSESIFGGIYAVISYIMFHKNAGKIYERPAARENFAFPFIIWQMFYLCLCIERVGRERKRQKIRFRSVMICKLTVLTAISLLCWQFSSFIFTTQIFIMIIPWSSELLSSRTFSIDYAVSQFLANIIAYLLSYGNRKYFFAWQNGPAVALLFISLVRIYKSQLRSSTEFSIKSIMLGITLAISSQGTIIDLLEKSGYSHPDDNPYTMYRSLILHWSLQRKLSFSGSLLACSAEFAPKDVAELWPLLKTMLVKPYCLYGVVLLTQFFRKWRKKNAAPKSTNDQAERAMKYVLEDFLEENHISMQDINNIERGKELGACWKLLKQCNFDYNVYKVEKSKTKAEKSNEHETFFSDIKRLKQQINNQQKQNKRKDEEEECKTNTSSNNTKDDIFENIKKPSEESENNLKEVKIQNIEEEEEEEDGENKDNLDDVSNSEQKEQKKTSQDEMKEDVLNNDENNDNEVKEGGSTAKDTTATSVGLFMNYYYLYSVCQLAAFAVVGLSIRKLFFLCYTQGCIVAPTICCKFSNHKQRHIFWAITFAVLFTSILDPGYVNVMEEYYSMKTTNKDGLTSMLEWININTEEDAVFGGPIEVIGSVHLATQRSIVNHAHLDTQQISERTEHIYSVLSRQQPSDIYNQCSQLKIQYLIISSKDCIVDAADDECDILTIWDRMQPAYRKYPQFCTELLYKNVPSFLKVYTNDQYAIIKMFSQSLQINLKYNKMPEKCI